MNKPQHLKTSQNNHSKHKRLSVSQFIKNLSNLESPLRIPAILAIAKMGSQAHKAVPVLASALKDKNSKVANYSGFALSQLGPRVKGAIPTILKALADRKDIELRKIAVHSLERMTFHDMKPVADKVVPALARALNDKNREIQETSLHTLAKMGPVAVEAIPALTKLLRHRSPTIRSESAYALGKIVIVANAPVLSVFKKLIMSEKDVGVLNCAVWAVKRIMTAPTRKRKFTMPGKYVNRLEFFIVRGAMTKKGVIQKAKLLETLN